MSVVTLDAVTGECPVPFAPGEKPTDPSKNAAVALGQRQ